MPRSLQRAVGAHLVAVALVALDPAPASAGWIVSTYGTGTPVGSWAHLEAAGVGHGNSTTYTPLRADWAGAVFQGYVASDASGSWNTIGAGTHDEDTIYVFR